MGSMSWRWFRDSPFIYNHRGRWSETTFWDSMTTRRPIQKHERLAFPHPDSLKRAALLVDRIYIPCWSTDDAVPLELTFGNAEIDRGTYMLSRSLDMKDWPWKIEDPAQKLQQLVKIYLGDPLAKYRTAYPQASIVPINFDIGTPMVPTGTHYAFQGALKHVPAVLEEALAWEQVSTFRVDPEACRKYRDLHLWLEYGISVTSEQHAADVIGQKLDDYRWAIKKHGLRTSAEAASSLLSLSAVVPPAGAVVTTAMGLGPVWGSLVGAGLAVAGATAWVSKRLLDLKDIRRGQHREVAYLYDLQKRVPRGRRARLDEQD